MTTAPRKSVKTRTQTAAPTLLSLDYQLAELPTSQHRAGLAGLVLLVKDWLPRLPGEKKGTCELTRLDDQGATLSLDLEGLRRLFDALYAASQEEQEVAQKWKKKDKTEVPPLREEKRTETDPRTGKTKTKTVYIYHVVVPKGAFLEDLDPCAREGKGPWIKLWRDMVWGILRGVPATREPYQARAEKRPTKDAEDVWSSLTKPPGYSVDLPSTYFLGAQANTAELVPFYDRARYQFLLHFWPLVAQVYIPERLNNEGKREFVGYAVAIPDVARLSLFCEELPYVLKNRSCQIAGYRPAEAVIDLAVEGALDVMRRLKERLAQREGEKSTATALIGVDVIHVEKQGNNVRLLSSSRLEPEATIIDEYAQLRGAFWDVSFRHQRLLNLVERRAWFHGFDRLFRTLPEEQTIKSNTFRHDAREVFEKELGMSDQDVQKAPDSLESLIYKIVGNYLRLKLKNKYNLKWDEAKQSEETKDKYSDARHDIARDAFYAIRSRTGADFVDYFVSTLCSEFQYLSIEQFEMLSQKLRTAPDDVRTLTLLALSAQGGGGARFSTAEDKND